MAQLVFTVLGCGSSGGVPRLGGQWGACDPDNPRNRRQRCSLLIERHEEDRTTTVLIDTSPDMRAQLLNADVGQLDGVVYTHAHADHVHGLDDLRMIVFNMNSRLTVWADANTQDDLLRRFGYAFVQPDGSPYPPILNLETLDGDVTIDGPGGAITLSPIRVGHGSIESLGFRVGDLAYIPDVADIYEHNWPKLAGLDCWIIDALRYKPHPSHSHLEQTLEWIERAAPKRAVLTNMHVDLDYATVLAETPEHVTPAFDGMTVSYEV